ncbi:MAG: hypothetical protein AB7T49_07800 [Oligoflexales bacterium]
MKHLLLAGCLLGSVPAFCGDWNSDGSELVKDSMNPWFIQNTKVVRYCLKHDPANFSLDAELASTHIRSAINFWLSELRSDEVKATAPMLGKAEGRYSRIEIGTQQFKEAPCSDDVDIQFLLGVIETDEQRRYLRNDPGQYAAIAVRTDYDRAELKGKGFVYFSPDRVESKDRYKGDRHHELFWSAERGSIFKNVVLHELGHIFGIPHTSINSLYAMHIMDANAAERLIAYPLESMSITKSLNWIPSNLQLSRCYENDPYRRGIVQKFFSMNAEHECLGLDYQKSTAPNVLYLRSWKLGPECPQTSPCSNSIPAIGRVTFTQKEEETTPLVRMMLESTQKVLAIDETYQAVNFSTVPKPEPSFSHMALGQRRIFVFGPGRKTVRYKGSYTVDGSLNAGDASPRPVLVTFSGPLSFDIKIGGSLDNRVYDDVVSGF